MGTEILLTVKDLAVILGKSEGAIRNDLSRDPEKLPLYFKIGRSIRWRPSTVSEWLDDLEKKQNSSRNRKKRRRGRPRKSDQINKLL